MSKVEDARSILRGLQVPEKQQTDLCCYTFLALANLKKRDEWSFATNEWMRIHDILAFIRKYYKVDYAENSRETFRKQALHHFRNAAFVEDNGKATNSPDFRYRLTREMLCLVQSFKSKEWELLKEQFFSEHDSLIALYASKRNLAKIPIKINGKDFSFSSGKHNLLQRAILEEFASRFAPGAQCLYIGDTAKRDLFKDEAELTRLGIEISLHDKMPDVVLYSKERNWLYFIEAVTSVGAMETKRVRELKEMSNETTAERIFVTAFPDVKAFKKFVEKIAWETEVWIADVPDHMIHLNGDKFLG